MWLEIDTVFLFFCLFALIESPVVNAAAEVVS